MHFKRLLFILFNLITLGQSNLTLKKLDSNSEFGQTPFRCNENDYESFRNIKRFFVNEDYLFIF